MANHPSAEKRHRQNLKRNERNREARSESKTAIKQALALAETGSFEEAKKAAQLATSLLDRAGINGLFHKNNVKRRISRLNSRIASMSQAAQR